ncbi:3-phosphoshikimate 1-carboxyvinyltransferase, partial [Candidatus Micrarchaeota archaeon]|nr:3-phosphoshikimate 1-carboxyvinyltransferase [Candidatus Micrarchaeota archaeon]
TIEGMKAFGAKIKRVEGNALEIIGTQTLTAPKKQINCKLSGSTIRFLIPIAALAKGKTVLSGKGSLLKRPMKPVIEALTQLGVKAKSNNGFPPVEIEGKGRIEGGRIEISGDVSSQFVSGLLFALPLAEEQSTVKITTKLESKPYVEITLDVLNEFGISAIVDEEYREFIIPGKQEYKAREYSVEGDYSSACFLLAAGAIAGGKVEVGNLRAESRQGDKKIIEILERMNARIKREGSACVVEKSELRGVEVDVGDIPDMAPILAVLACCAKGKTRIYNAGRLRIKESDRLAAISSELKKMGARITEKQDELIVEESKLKGAVVESHDDHRIAMACAIAALCAEGKTTVKKAEAVTKSYPNFFEDLKKLEAEVKT